jgi:hypothetical protein
VSSLIAIVNYNNNKYLAKQLSDREEIANESYVKFLDQSRNQAYEYIEDVQARLSEFANEVEPQLDYFNKYGKDISGPHQIVIDIIDKAYRNLMIMLPENNKEKTNNE